MSAWINITLNITKPNSSHDAQRAFRANFNLTSVRNPYETTKYQYGRIVPVIKEKRKVDNESHARTVWGHKKTINDVTSRDIT